VRKAVAARDLPLSHRLLLLVTERGPGDVPPGLGAHLHAMRASVTIAEGGDPVAIELDLGASKWLAALDVRRATEAGRG
jgi:hypothetical protein